MPLPSPTRPLLVLPLAFALALPAPSARAADAAVPGPGADWPAHGRTADEQRYSPLDAITTANVGRLGHAWTTDLGTTRGMEATPLVVDGVMYVTSAWSRVFALDAATGRELWRYDPQVPGAHARKGCCDVVNRGVAVADGRVFVGTYDGRLVALDAATGKVAWEVLTVDRSQPYTITGAPRVFRDKVIIGNGGAEFGVRGYLSAYDAKTGALAWRFYTVPGGPDGPFEHPELEAAAKTWPREGQWRQTGGGGTVWDAMAYDPALDLLYVGTGNGSPHARHLRSPGGGDNLYLSSILALDPDTGRLAWHYQTTPGDSWDYTATQSIILADLAIGGRTRQVLMQAPKNGFFYVLDRRTGKLLAADKYAAANWASHVDLDTGRPVELPQADYSREDRLVYPSELGAHNWQPMAFSPKTGLAYIPAMEKPWIFSPKGFYLFDAEVPHIEALRAGQPAPGDGGYLRAWDPVRRTLAWEVRHAALVNGGLLATAGDLVFQGTQDGHLNAFDARDGRLLARIATGTGIVAPPITYALGGTQYVAFVTGFGGATLFMLEDGAAGRQYVNAGRVIALRLDGGAVPFPQAVPAAAAAAAAALPADPDRIGRGRALYLRHCSFCHGMSGSVPLLPDLSRVGSLGLPAFRAIVLDGVLEGRGMSRFSDVLGGEDVDALYEAIVHGAHNRPRR